MRHDSLRGVRAVRVTDDGYTFAVLPQDFLPGITANGTRWQVERLPDGRIVAGLTDDALAALCADIVGDDKMLDTRMGELVMLLAGPDRWEEAVWIQASLAARNGKR